MKAFRGLKMLTAAAAVVTTAGLGLVSQPAGAATNNFRSGSTTINWYTNVPTNDGQAPTCSLSVWLQQDTSATGRPVVATGNVHCNFVLKTTVGTTYLKDTNVATGQTAQKTASTTFYNSYGMGTRWLSTAGFYACSGWKTQGVFTVNLTDNYGHPTYSTYVTTGSPVLPPTTQSC